MDFTIEFNDIINYMYDILLTEFPTDKITVEYLVLSILDRKKCHAFAILDNKLTSSSDFYGVHFSI